MRKRPGPGPIRRCPDPAGASIWARDQRAAGRRIGFVPTMGALHPGHLSLLSRAVDECDVTCASIFVNPLQFNNPEDLEKYPRDTEADVAMLQQLGCSMVFFGTLETFFPEVSPPHAVPLIDPGPCARGLEGEHRPGHFAGVVTIVERLFKTIGECDAYFGEKDFQQTLVVRDLARRMGYPRVAVCPTVRERSGLAMSSRNQRLSDSDRQTASVIYRSLLAARDAWSAGERHAGSLQAIVKDVLALADHLEVEYAEIRDPERWTAGPPDGMLTSARALVAATIGGVRLIDNMRLDTDDSA